MLLFRSRLDGFDFRREILYGFWLGDRTPGETWHDFFLWLNLVDTSLDGRMKGVHAVRPSKVVVRIPSCCTLAFDVD